MVVLLLPNRLDFAYHIVSQISVSVVLSTDLTEESNHIAIVALAVRDSAASQRSVMHSAIALDRSSLQQILKELGLMIAIPMPTSKITFTTLVMPNEQAWE